MKKVFLFLLCALGFALSSQAVYIYWDMDELNEVTEQATSAQLVYYASDQGGLAFDSTGAITGGSTPINVPNSGTFSPTMAYEEGYLVDVGAEPDSSGTWYVVLFNNNGDYISSSVSASSVAYWNGDISNPVNMTTGMGTLNLSVQAWAPTPEPCSVALLLLGAAAVAARRKKLII